MTEWLKSKPAFTHSFSQSVSHQSCQCAVIKKSLNQDGFLDVLDVRVENGAWQEGALRLACWHVANNKQENRLKSSQHTCNLSMKDDISAHSFSLRKIHYICLFKHNYPYLRQNEEMKSSQWYFCVEKRNKQKNENVKFRRGGKGVNTNRERYESVWLKNKKAVGASESTHSIS